MDRARDALRRQTRRIGHNPEPFRAGEGYLFDKRGFGWHQDVFLVKGRLLAIARYMTNEHREPHPWAGMAQHAISCVEDEHMDVWGYQSEFFNIRSGSHYFACEALMDSYWAWLQHPEEMEGVST
jgi:hypothetical protein